MSMLQEASSETVSQTERRDERSQSDKLSLRVPQSSGEVIVKHVKGFQCPACGEVLSEAVVMNGSVSGWCGVKGVYVKEVIQ